MKQSLFYLMLAFSIFVFACSKQNAQLKNKSSGTSKDLAGTWDWVRSQGGIANNIYETPASTGKNIALMLTQDKKYFVYTNNVVTSQGTYVLETRKCIHDNSDKPFINFSSASDADVMVESKDQENLELSDEAYDGVERFYKLKIGLE